MGSTCRFCFRDQLAARVADAIVIPLGQRVVMCETHEPPVSSRASFSDVTAHNSKGSTVKRVESDMDTNDETSGQVSEIDEAPTDASEIKFTDQITRGQLCIFMPGYFEFLGETSVLTYSVLYFMPGARVMIPTSSLDFHVFNR